MDNKEHIKSTTPQFTSTPRVCRKPINVLNAFVEVSPIFPVNESKPRSKSLIPVLTCNTQSGTYARRKTLFDSVGFPKNSQPLPGVKLPAEPISAARKPSCPINLKGFAKNAQPLPGVKLPSEPISAAKKPSCPINVKGLSKNAQPLPGEKLQAEPLSAAKKPSFPTNVEGLSKNSHPIPEIKPPNEPINTAKKPPCPINMEGGIQLKTTIKPRDSAMKKMSLVLPTIPENEQCSGMTTVPVQRSSCVNILKDENIGDTAQSDWQVPPDTKKRVSLKSKMNKQKLKESVLESSYQKLLQHHVKFSCESEDDLSPFELCHSSKKRKVVAPNDDDQKNLKHKKLSIENITKISVVCGNNEKCNSHPQGGQNTCSKLDDNPDKSSKTNIKTHPKTLEKGAEAGILSSDSPKLSLKENKKQLNIDKEYQLVSPIKSKRKVAKKVQEVQTAVTKDANNTESSSNNKIDISNNYAVPNCRVSKQKKILNNDGNNEIVDTAEKNNFGTEKDSSSSLTKTQLKECPDKINKNVNKECESTSTNLRKMPVKKTVPRKNRKVDSKNEMLLGNNLDEIETAAVTNAKSTIKKISKICTETSKSDARYQDASGEIQLQQNTFLKEQQSNIITDNAHNISTNTHNLKNAEIKLNNLNEEEIEVAIEKKQIKRKRGRPALKDQKLSPDLEIAKEEVNDHQDYVQLKLIDSIKSNQINDKTHIICTGKKTNNNRSTVNRSNSNGNTNSNLTEDITSVHKKVIQTQKLDLKSIGKDSEKIELNNDESHKACINDESFLKPANTRIKEVAIGKNLSPSQERKPKSRKCKTKNEINQNKKKQEINDKACTIVSEGTGESKGDLKTKEENLNGKKIISVEDKVSEEGIVNTRKRKMKENNNNESKDKINLKEGKINHTHNQQQLQAKNETCNILDGRNISNKENKVNPRKYNGKKKSITVEENSGSHEGVIQVKNHKSSSKNNENKATDRRLSSRKRRACSTNQSEPDYKSSRSTKKRKASEKDIEVVSKETTVLPLSYEENVSSPVINNERVFRANKCFGVKTEKVTMKQGIPMQTFVHLSNFVLSGSFSIHPGGALTKSSTNTVYFVTNGRATVRIGSITKTVSCQDQICSFFIPGCTDFSIKNEEEEDELKLLFTKFSG